MAFTNTNGVSNSAGFTTPAQGGGWVLKSHTGGSRCVFLVHAMSKVSTFFEFCLMKIQIGGEGGAAQLSKSISQGFNHQGGHFGDDQWGKGLVAGSGGRLSCGVSPDVLRGVGQLGVRRGV